MEREFNNPLIVHCANWLILFNEKKPIGPSLAVAASEITYFFHSFPPFRTQSAQSIIVALLWIRYSIRIIDSLLILVQFDAIEALD